MSLLAKNLKSKLHEKDISVHALERLAGLKPSVVHNILQGKSKNPTANTLQAISRALHCPVDELLNSASTPQTPTTWNGDLYKEAIEVANNLFKEQELNLNKEQALNFIDEIYLYALQCKITHIDRQFSLWLIQKLWPKAE